MSVGSVSSVVSAADVSDGASFLVARKALDIQKQEGEATLRLLESANVEGNKGQNLDVMV